MKLIDKLKAEVYPGAKTVTVSPLELRKLLAVVEAAQKHKPFLSPEGRLAKALAALEEEG